MKTFFRSLVFALCLLPTLAFGQANVCINASGGACGTAPTGNALTTTGVSFVGTGALYALASSSLQFAGPFSVSVGIKFTSLSALTNWLHTTGATGGNVGFSAGFTTSTFNNSEGIVFQVQPGASGTCGNSQLCARQAYVNDGNWHQYCATYSSGVYMGLYIDGVLVDHIVRPASFTNSTSFWQVGTANQPLTIRDQWVWSKDIGAVGCATMAQLANLGLSPSAGFLTTNVVAHWPMDACDVTGCTDSLGVNNLLYDSTPPVVVVTVPSNGASGLTGNQTVTATCVDTIVCANVLFYIDNATQPIVSSSPYTLTWDTTKVADGSHTIFAVGTNNSGVQGTSSTITVSTSNGVSNKTVYMDPTSGNDCPSNTGLSTGSPCSTLAGVMSVINANPLLGGDSILFQHGTNLNITAITDATVLLLNGPLSSKGAQNVYPGKTITIGTYGGSGNCHVLSAVTTDCASITFSTNGSTTIWDAIINKNNAPNIVLQNLRLFGSQTNAIQCPGGGTGGNECNFGWRDVSSGNFAYRSGSPAGYISAQNIETTDFSAGGYVADQADPQGSSNGQLCGPIIQNNYFHGSALGAQVGAGLTIQGVTCFNGVSLNNPTGSQAISNVVQNIGGYPGNADGSGIQFLSRGSFGGSSNIVDQFNVTGNSSTNDTTCGGSYGNWWNGVLGAVIQGNESYNQFPTAALGCDKGAFDIDNGVQRIVLEDNYAHNTYGPSLSELFSSEGSVSGTGFNTIAYNILENGNSLTHDQNGGMIDAGASAGYAHHFNNVMWNGFNGLIVSPAVVKTLSASLALGFCPPTQSYIANNVLVTTDNSVSFVQAEFYYGGFNISCSSAHAKFVTNDWYVLHGTPLWRSVQAFTTSYTTLSAWNLANSSADISALPGFSGTGGLNVVCYTAGSGVPTQPGLTPCPAWATITNGAATENTGTDLSQAPYSLYTTVLDYYGNTVPYTGHGGTGTNMGVDGKFE